MSENVDLKKIFEKLLGEASETFELALKLASRDWVVGPTEKWNQNEAAHHASSIVNRALIYQFVFASRRAYRVCEQGKAQLLLDRNVRKIFMTTLKTIVDVRDLIEHGSDVSFPQGKNLLRPKPISYLDGRLKVMSLTIIVIDGTSFLLGGIKLNDIFDAVVAMRKSVNLDLSK